MRPYLSLLEEGAPAGGAGNADGAVAPGDPDAGLAGGALKVAMGLAALDPLEALDELLIFPVALGDIPGEDAENGQDQGDIGQQSEYGKLGKGPDQAQDDAQDAQGPGQGIYAVAAGHKAADAVANSLKHGMITS